MGAIRKATKYKYKRTMDSVHWKTCADAVTKYLAKEMASFHMVEKKSFKDMVRVLDAQYELPGGKHFSAVPCLNNKVRDTVQVLLSEADSYSLTTDMWSSVNMTPYMSLTVHAIRPTPEWKLESKCLQTMYFLRVIWRIILLLLLELHFRTGNLTRNTFSHNHW